MSNYQDKLEELRQSRPAVPDVDAKLLAQFQKLAPTVDKDRLAWIVSAFEQAGVAAGYLFQSHMQHTLKRKLNLGVRLSLDKQFTELLIEQVVDHFALWVEETTEEDFD